MAEELRPGQVTAEDLSRVHTLTAKVRQCRRIINSDFEVTDVSREKVYGHPEMTHDAELHSALRGAVVATAEQQLEKYVAEIRTIVPNWTE